MSRSARRLLSLLTAAAVVSTVAACSGSGSDAGPSRAGGDGGGNEASDVGITEDTIRLGGHFPVGGVEAPGAVDIPLGITAYFEHVNANGGVNGRSVEYLYEDDAYDPADAGRVVRELVRRDEVFAIVGGLGTPTQRDVVEFLNEEGVPDLFVSSGSRLRGGNPEDHPFTFGWQPDHLTEGQTIGRYVAEELPDARVGLLLQDDDLGRDGEAGIRQHVDDDRIVEVQRYTAGDTGVGTQLSALAASGADVVVGMTSPTYTALSQLRAAELGFDPQWIYSHVGSDPALAGPLDGAITTRYLPRVAEQDDEWIRLFRRIWDAHGGEGELTDHGVAGMAIAYTAVQALQAAGQNPTREGLVEALEQVGGGFEGPVRAPFRWSVDSHLGAGGMAVGRLGAGVLEELRPVRPSDIGDAGIAAWVDDDVAGPPENGIPDEEFYE